MLIFGAMIPGHREDRELLVEAGRVRWKSVGRDDW